MIQAHGHLPQLSLEMALAVLTHQPHWRRRVHQFAPEASAAHLLKPLAEASSLALRMTVAGVRFEQVMITKTGQRVQLMEMAWGKDWKESVE